ncbi:hypothetical protein [Streptomyces sp. SD15]
MYDGAKVLGPLPGGSGDCAEGGVTFFQPPPEVLKGFRGNVY